MIKCNCDKTKPYIFVSYSHKDSEEVHTIIEKMYNGGYNIWFDDGTDSEAEWDGNIASKLKGAYCFLAFISKNYLNSSNCKDELNFARDLTKERLIVFLEDVELPNGIQMWLNRAQAVYKYTYENDEEFYKKLYPPLKEFHLPNEFDYNKPKIMLDCRCDETKPYIFASYSHKDSKEVHRIIGRMYNDRYNVWFDEGIDPGTEWDEYIASHVEEAKYFIAFISKNYVNSSNCKDELNWARDLDKERLIVYIEDVELPKGMQMRLNRVQAIYKYTYENDDKFYKKLFSPLKEFRLPAKHNYEESKSVNLWRHVYYIVRAISTGEIGRERDYSIIEMNLSLIDPEGLSKEERTIPNLGFKLASDYENWYSYMTKALLEQQKYDECIECCDKALESISKFHTDNDIWFNYRKAVSLRGVDKIYEGTTIIKKIVVREGFRHWCFYEYLFDDAISADDEKSANVYGAKCATADREHKMRVTFYQKYAEFLENHDNIREAMLLHQLIILVRQEEGWNEKSYFADWNISGEVKQMSKEDILKELNVFWHKLADRNEFI